MKSKTVFVSLILVAIIGVGFVVYFVSRPKQQEQDPLPQQFAKLPEKPSFIAEFHHGPRINSVAISPVDPSLIASVDENGTIKLWDRNNTKEPVKILSHPGLDASIDFSPTGELLASSGLGTLVLWDVALGKKINSLENSYREFAFSPDGQHLATVRAGVKLWDIRNPKEITEVATLPFNEAGRVNGWACAVDISPDGKLIATKYTNGTINVWDIQTKQLVKTLETSLSERGFLKFSPDNKFLVSGGPERYISDNKYWASSSPYGYLIWELPEWQRYGEVQRGDADNLVFSPDGKMCALANSYSFLGRGTEIWSTATGAPITSLPIGARDVSFSHDGNMLAAGGEDGVLRLWKFTPQQLAHETTPNDVIRILYLLPKDKEPPSNITAKLDKSIREVQDFYAKEMERHGFGRKTFTFETDESGKAKIYLFQGQQVANFDILKQQIPDFDLSNDIWLAVFEKGTDFPVGAFHGQNAEFWYPTHDGMTSKNNIWGGMIEGITHGKLIFLSATNGEFDWRNTAYELKYAFACTRYTYNSSISKCEAEWLDKSRFFNPNQPFFDKRPGIGMRVSEPDAKNSRRFQFEVTDEDGIHQVQLFVGDSEKPWSVRKKFQDCQILNGKTQSTVEFEISNLETKNVELRMIDMYGNTAWRAFKIK